MSTRDVLLGVAAGIATYAVLEAIAGDIGTRAGARLRAWLKRKR